MPFTSMLRGYAAELEEMDNEEDEDDEATSVLRR